MKKKSKLSNPTFLLSLLAVILNALFLIIRIYKGRSKERKLEDAAKCSPATEEKVPTAAELKPEAEPVKPEAEPVKPEAEPVKPEAEPVKSDTEKAQGYALDESYKNDESFKAYLDFLEKSDDFDPQLDGLLPKWLKHLIVAEERKAHGN